MLFRSVDGVSLPANNLFTGLNQFQNIGGIQTWYSSTIQDGVNIIGRNGGTGSWRSILTPTTLSGNRTLTLPDVSGTVITTGNLSSITAVGTLTSGSIPSSLLSGTIDTARISGSYTNITAVGTLTSLTSSGTISGQIVIGDDTNSPAISLRGWPTDTNWASIDSNRGYLLLGHPSTTSGIYLRTYSTSTAVRIGANGQDTLVAGYNSSYSLYSVTIDGLAFCNNWWRSTGQSGWYNETYGGGIWMNDSTFVRVYASKLFLASGIWDSSAATSSMTGYNYVVRGTTFGNYAYFTSNKINKRDIEPIINSGLLIDQMNPVTYKEKILESDTEESIFWKDNDLEYGFIAEEMAEVGDGFLANYRGLPDGSIEPAGWKFHGVVSVLVAEVKDLRKRINILENK